MCISGSNWPLFDISNEATHTFLRNNFFHSYIKREICNLGKSHQQMYKKLFQLSKEVALFYYCFCTCIDVTIMIA